MPETLRATDPLAGDWILLVMLAALGMLGWINLVSPKKWRLLTRSFFSFRLGRQSLRDELDVQDRTLIGLAVMASAALALLGYQFVVLVGGLPPGIGLWTKLFGVLLLVLLLQVLLVWVVGRVFQGDGGLSEYLYTLLLLHVVLGVALLPVTASIAWPHDVSTAEGRPAEVLWRTYGLWIGAAMVSVVTVFRWLRAAVLGLGAGVPLRYVLVYLCALEILPVALLSQQALRYLPDLSHPL